MGALLPVSVCYCPGIVTAAILNIGKGFADHGVAVPFSNPRGIVATHDGRGNNIVLVWLADHRGCYELLMIDAETGVAKEYAIPDRLAGSGSPFASILSSSNKYYTLFGGTFYEFDPRLRRFSFVHKSMSQHAMSMTEDDNGVIWSASYPKCSLVSYNPVDKIFKDYGQIYAQDWDQYPRYLAADDAGWVYLGIGTTASQLIAFNSTTATAVQILEDTERVHGSALVYRDINGKVYGYTGGNHNEGKWLELHEGQRRTLTSPPSVRHKPGIFGTQDLFYQHFPDGKLLRVFDTIAMSMVVENPRDQENKHIALTYHSEGARIMAMCAAPGKTINGGSSFPFLFFSYDPENDTWIRERAFLQFKTVVRQGARWYAGGYPEGWLLEWDPEKPWKNSHKGTPAGNPSWLISASPDINRPHDLIALPDGKTLVLAGTPGYGLTGGGVMIWDSESKKGTVVKHTGLVLDQSPMSLVVLSGGNILVGTTTAAGTGGQVKGKEAELAILDMSTQQTLWHGAVLDGVRNYSDMYLCPNGLVAGFADGRRFFVFDPESRRVLLDKDIFEELGPTSGSQQTRIFLSATNGDIYLLLKKGIAYLCPDTFDIKMLAWSPVPIESGGDYHNGRLYFGSGSHLMSWRVE